MCVGECHRVSDAGLRWLRLIAILVHRNHLFLCKPGEAQEVLDDFQLILPSFKAPDIGGIIIGSPSHFRSMSSLCKAFLERLAVLRSRKLLLSDKTVGVLAVGAYRNGGEELVIERIQAAMLCHEVVVVGGKPSAHQGATLWNAYNTAKDEFGITTAKQLGIRVAEAVLRCHQLK
jgi:multimeric flavodoxin WrbA